MMRLKIDLEGEGTVELEAYTYELLSSWLVIYIDPDAGDESWTWLAGDETWIGYRLDWL